jgi:major membrane immunogen (membrane-anchored lipoprotein)
MPKKAIAITTAALAIVLLAGCSSSDAHQVSSNSSSSSSKSASDSNSKAAASSSQTKAQACAVIGKDMQSISSQVQSQMTKFSSDPTAAVATLQQFDTKLKAAVAEVQNPDVKTQATTFEQAYSGLVGQLAAFAKDPKSVDTTKLQASVTQVETATQGIEKVCG